VILGPGSEYNEIQNWDYARLPSVFAQGARIAGATVRNELELERALVDAGNAEQMTLIELAMDKMDAPAGLLRMGPVVAEYDFGERGPQARTKELSAVQA